MPRRRHRYTGPGITIESLTLTPGARVEVAYVVATSPHAVVRHGTVYWMIPVTDLQPPVGHILTHRREE